MHYTVIFSLKLNVCGVFLFFFLFSFFLIEGLLFYCGRRLRDWLSISEEHASGLDPCLCLPYVLKTTEPEEAIVSGKTSLQCYVHCPAALRQDPQK